MITPSRLYHKTPAMYRPIQPGVHRLLKDKIVYREAIPSTAHRSLAHCFWTLRTRVTLEEDFQYLVLPDACLDIVFDLTETPSFDGALIMTPATTAKSLNLGKTFSYTGIRLLPGAWLASPIDTIIGGSVQVDSLMEYDFRRLRQQLMTCTTYKQAILLNQAVADLEQRGVIGKSALTHALLSRSGLSVEDFTVALGYSRRHVQRLLGERIGYKPREFVKILRFQQSLRNGTLDGYADQSHYIRECRRITGMTPREFRSAYLS